MDVSNDVSHNGMNLRSKRTSSSPTIKPSPLCRKPITYLESITVWDDDSDTAAAGCEDVSYTVSPCMSDCSPSPGKRAVLPTVDAELLPYFTCSLCEQGDFASLSAYFDHLWREHAHLQAVGGRVGRVPVRLRPQLFVTCALCGQHNSGSAGEAAEQLAVAHMPRHAPLLAALAAEHDTWRCGECDWQSDSRGALALHCLDSQCRPPVRTCPQCGAQVEGEQNYIGHLCGHYVQALYRCYFCQSVMASEAECVAHIKRHHAAEYCVHRCARCGHTTALLHDFVQHVRTHSHLNRLACDLCDAVFQSKKSLIDHTMTHSVASFVCDACERHFSHPQTLRRHRLNAHGRPHLCVCTDCGRQFATVYSMKRHRATHTGERPHQCDKCGRSYVQRNDLKLHVRRCKYATASSEFPPPVIDQLFQ